MTTELPPTPAILTVKEAAAELRTTTVTIRAWLHSGRLRGVKIGGDRLGWRIPASELRRLLENPE